MQYWKSHTKLRFALILAFFVAGLALVIGGWRITGKLSGLVIMLVGLALLLAALFIYNKPFETPRGQKRIK